MIACTPRVIVPLDFPDMLSAFGRAARLDPRKCAVKVAKELFTAAEAAEAAVQLTGASDPLAALDAINASIGGETKVPA
jgi:orotidine-5'-phosphate decarboxylase